MFIHCKQYFICKFFHFIFPFEKFWWVLFQIYLINTSSLTSSECLRLCVVLTYPWGSHSLNFFSEALAAPCFCVLWVYVPRTLCLGLFWRVGFYGANLWSFPHCQGALPTSYFKILFWGGCFFPDGPYGEEFGLKSKSELTHYKWSESTCIYIYILPLQQRSWRQALPQGPPWGYFSALRMWGAVCVWGWERQRPFTWATPPAFRDPWSSKTKVVLDL